MVEAKVAQEVNIDIEILIQLHIAPNLKVY